MLGLGTRQDWGIAFRLRRFLYSAKHYWTLHIFWNT